MPTLKSRLEQEDPPGNYYELLEVACFSDELDSILASVRSATKFLHQYQNHKNSTVVQRARSLQLLCATAAHTFSDAEKWRAYNAELMASFRDEFRKQGSNVNLKDWLRDTCHVVSHRVDEVADFVRSSPIQQTVSTAFSHETQPDHTTNVLSRNPPFDIQNYEVLERLGEGGIGVVYKARHRQLDKLFAMKLLRNDKSIDSSAVTRFLREMKAIGKLDHPNIIRATDAGQHGDTRFLVTELIDGCNLQELVGSRGPLSVKDACGIIIQASLGLQHAHEKGLVHRDIKPSNLMFSRDGTVKILDLGLALLVPTIGDGPLTDELTADGLIVGTVDYMAPEQRHGRQNVDARSDVYSLGCTMFFLLTGQVLFRESGSDLFVRMAAHATQPVASLSRFRGDVPAEVEAIMRRMLAKVPQDRFGSGGEVAEALSSAVKHCRLTEDRGDSLDATALHVRSSSPLTPPILGRGSQTPPAIMPNVPTANREKPGTPAPPLLRPASVTQEHAPRTTAVATQRTQSPPLVKPVPPVPKTPPPVLRPGTDGSVPMRVISQPTHKRSDAVLWWVTAAILAFTMIGVVGLVALTFRSYHSDRKKNNSEKETRVIPIPAGIGKNSQFFG